MHISSSTLSTTETLPGVRKKLRAASWLCTGITAAILAIHLLAGVPLVRGWLPFLTSQTMLVAESAVIAVALFCLLCALQNRTLAGLRLSQALAALEIVFCLCRLLGAAIQHTTDPILFFFGRMPTVFALSFLLFGLLLFLEPVKNLPGVIAGDSVALALCIVTMFQVFTALLSRMKIFAFLTPSVGTLAPVICLLLLSIAAVLRRTDRGIFSIFLGDGIGSRIAQYLCPLVLVVPFLRESIRARVLNSGRIPPLLATAGLSALASTIALGLVLFLAWRIASMEEQIRSLTLRDGLTDLYNLRGLRMLGEQALQLARRAGLPFSVLYIDMDNLKHVNDTHGHAAGSELLRETSDLLVTTFRVTDVVARVGGDEFVVAGQFSEAMLGLAVRRLGEMCSRRNGELDNMYGISFSIGHVTSHGSSKESLEELLARSDRAMYETKRQKKAHRESKNSIAPPTLLGSASSPSSQHWHNSI